MTLPIKLLTKTAQYPIKGSSGAAGYDLYADRPLFEDEPFLVDSFSNGFWYIKPGETVLIPTGIAMAIPYGYFGAIYPRSGIATKMGLRLANCVAVIDSDYRGEIKIPIYNDSDALQNIEYATRIAQIVIQPYEDVEIKEVADLSTTTRGGGGFGSTGKN